MSAKDFAEDLGFKEGVVVGCLLTIGVAALFVLLGMRVDTSTAVKWWELMTAFGTVGAVIVALGLALKEANERRLGRLRQRAILRWVVGPEIGTLAGNLHATRTVLARLKATSLGGTMNKEDLVLLKWLAEKLQLPACQGVLDRIDVLYHSESFALAAIVGKTPLLQSQLLWLSTLIIPVNELTHRHIEGYDNDIAKILSNIYSSELGRS